MREGVNQKWQIEELFYAKILKFPMKIQKKDGPCPIRIIGMETKIVDKRNLRNLCYGFLQVMLIACQQNV